MEISWKLMPLQFFNYAIHFWNYFEQTVNNLRDKGWQKLLKIAIYGHLITSHEALVWARKVERSQLLTHIFLWSSSNRLVIENTVIGNKTIKIVFSWLIVLKTSKNADTLLAQKHMWVVKWDAETLHAEAIPINC